MKCNTVEMLPQVSAIIISALSFSKQRAAFCDPHPHPSPNPTDELKIPDTVLVPKASSALYKK